jgi:hypothetical protein
MSAISYQISNVCFNNFFPTYHEPNNPPLCILAAERASISKGDSEETYYILPFVVTITEA